MMTILAFFGLAAALGYALLGRVPVRLEAGHRFLWSLPLGVELLALAGFLAARLTGDVTWGMGLAGVLALGVVVILRREFIPSPLKIRTSRWIPFLAVTLPWLAFAAWVYPTFLVYHQGALVSSWPNVWGDWPLHLRATGMLHLQTPFSLENSLLSGTQARYPLGGAFLAAFFQRAGLEARDALVWSGFPFFALLPALVFSFLRGLGLRPWFAATGGALFLFSGGLGVVDLVRDWISGVPVFQVDPYRLRLYTDMRAPGTPIVDQIWFINVIACEFAPQRAFTFGLPWGLVVFLWLWQRFVLRPTLVHLRREAVVWGGAWAGLLLLHTHSALAVALAAVPLAVWKVVREGRKPGFRPGSALVLVGSACGFGGAVFLEFLMQPGQLGGFGHPIAGWLPGPAGPGETLWFLVRNFGIVLLGFLTLGGVAVRSRALLWGGLGIFVAANLYSFQPWAWDNMKLLTWWWLLAVAATLLGLQSLWVRVPNRPARIARNLTAGVLLLTAVGAGVADVVQMGVVAPQKALVLTGPDGVAFARDVQAYLSEGDRRTAVVALAPDHNHPISLLTGARIYLGYPGWVWSYGLPTQDREDRLTQLYQGGPEALTLAHNAGIRYIVWGPAEQRRFGDHQGALLSEFRPVIQTQGWQLLEVPDVHRP